MRLWGVDDEEARGALNGPELGSNAVVFSPDGKTPAIAGNNEFKTIPPAGLGTSLRFPGCCTQ